MAPPPEGWLKGEPNQEVARRATGGPIAQATASQATAAAAQPGFVSPLAARIAAGAEASAAAAAAAQGEGAAQPTEAEPGGLHATPAGGAAASGLSEADFLRLWALSDTRDLRTSAQVLDRIREVADIFTACGDRRGVFPVAYEVITEQSRRSLLGGSFAHPLWAEALIVKFAGLYFDNLRGHLEGGEVTPAWQTYFARAADPAASVSEVLGSGVVAHLVDDLPLSLAEIGSQPEQSEDFKHFGRQLLKVAPELVEQLKRRYQDDVSPLLTGFQVGRWLDGLLGEGTTTALAFQSIRQKAWIMGQRLQHDCTEQAARFEMASSLAVFNAVLRWVV